MSAPAISDKDMEDLFGTGAVAAATAHPDMFESNFFDNSTYGFSWSSPFGPVPTTSTSSHDAIASADAALFDSLGEPSQLALDLSGSAFDLAFRPAGGVAHLSASARSEAPRSRKLVHQLRQDGQGISSTELLSLEGQDSLGFPMPTNYDHDAYVSLSSPSYGCSSRTMLPSTPPITPNPARIRPRTSTSPIRKHRTAPSVPVTSSSTSILHGGSSAAKRSKSYSTLKAKPMLADRRSPKHQRSHHQLSMLQTSISHVPNLPLSPPASSRFPADLPSLSTRSSTSGLHDFAQHHTVAYGGHDYAVSDFSTSSPPLWSECGPSFESSFGGSSWNMGSASIFGSQPLHEQQITPPDPLSAASGDSLGSHDSHPGLAPWDMALAQTGLMISTDNYPWDVPHPTAAATPSISPLQGISSSTYTEQPPVQRSSLTTLSHESHASPYESATMKRPSDTRTRRPNGASRPSIVSHASSAPRLSSPASSSALSKPKPKKSYGSLKNGGAGTQSPRKARSMAAMHSAATTGNMGLSAAGEGGFVNFTPSDSRRILTGVAPSGSSKTKARREREAIERRRRLSEAATKAVREAGGNWEELQRQGVLEELTR